MKTTISEVFLHSQRSLVKSKSQALIKFQKMKIICILFGIILLAQSAFGQREREFNYSGGIGFGIGGVKFSKQNAGLSLNTSAQLQYCSSIYELSYSKWFGFGLFTPPSEYIVSYSVKYGKEFNFQREGGLFSLLSDSGTFTNYSVQLKTGISFLEGRERTSVKYQRLIEDEYNSKDNMGFGIPFEIEVRGELSKSVGLCAKFAANLNANSPFYDISLGVYFGDL